MKNQGALLDTKIQVSPQKTSVNLPPGALKGCQIYKILTHVANREWNAKLQFRLKNCGPRFRVNAT